MKRTVSLLGALLLTGSANVSLVYAAADWPFLGRDVSRSSSSSTALGSPLSQVWSASLPGQPLTSVTSDGTRAFVGTDQGRLVAVSLDSGKVLWSFQAGDRIYSTPAVASGTIYFASYDRHLYAVEAATGKQAWKLRTGGNEMSSPVVEGNLVYMASGFPNQKIIAVGTDGKMRWERDLGQISYSSPALLGASLFIAANNGVLSALEASTGSALWKRNTKGSVMLASPTVSSGGTVLFAPGGEDANVYAFNSEGKSLWKQPLISLAKAAPGRAVAASIHPACDDPIENQRLGGECERQKAAHARSANAPMRAPEKPSGPSSILVSNPAISGGTACVLATITTQKAFGIAVEDGRILWETEVGIPSTPAFVSSPVFAGSSVYVGTGNGELVVLNGADGAKAQVVQLGGPINTAPALAGGKLIVATENGKLIALK